MRIASFQNTSSIDKIPACFIRTWEKSFFGCCSGSSCCRCCSCSRCSRSSCCCCFLGCCGCSFSCSYAWIRFFTCIETKVFSYIGLFIFQSVFSPTLAGCEIFQVCTFNNLVIPCLVYALRKLFHYQIRIITLVRFWNLQIPSVSVEVKTYLKKLN